MIVCFRKLSQPQFWPLLIPLQFDGEIKKKSNILFLHGKHFSPLHISETNLICLSWLNSFRGKIYTVQKRMTQFTILKLFLCGSAHWLESLHLYMTLSQVHGQCNLPKVLNLIQIMVFRAFLLVLNCLDVSHLPLSLTRNGYKDFQAKFQYISFHLLGPLN